MSLQRRKVAEIGIEIEIEIELLAFWLWRLEFKVHTYVLLQTIPLATAKFHGTRILSWNEYCDILFLRYIIIWCIDFRFSRNVCAFYFSNQSHFHCGWPTEWHWFECTQNFVFLLKRILEKNRYFKSDGKSIFSMRSPAWSAMLFSRKFESHIWLNYLYISLSIASALSAEKYDYSGNHFLDELCGTRAKVSVANCVERTGHQCSRLFINQYQPDRAFEVIIHRRTIDSLRELDFQQCLLNLIEFVCTYNLSNISFIQKKKIICLIQTWDRNQN